MRENTVIWSMVPRPLFYCILFLDLPSEVKKRPNLSKEFFSYPQSFSLLFLDPTLGLQYTFWNRENSCWIRSATCKTVKDEVLRTQFCTEPCFLNHKYLYSGDFPVWLHLTQCHGISCKLCIKSVSSLYTQTYLPLF